MKIRIVHRILALAVVASLGVLAVVGVFLLQRSTELGYRQEITRLDKVSDQLSDLNNTLNANRRLEKDFLLEKSPEMQAAFVDTTSTARSMIAGLRATVSDAGKASLAAIETDYGAYAASVGLVMDKNTELGLVPSEGLEGKMREAVHGIETRLTDVENDKLLVSMLMLRRHEKDLMLRQDPKYVAKHEEEATNFTDLAKASLPPAMQSDILSALDIYTSSFKAYASGVLAETAARAEADAAFAKLAPEIQSTLEGAHNAAAAQLAASDAAVARAQTIAMGVVLATLLVLGIAVFLIGRSIARPVASMAAGMHQIAGGDTDVAVVGLDRRDEIGEMATALEVFRNAAISNRKLEREAAENRARAETERVRLQEEAEAAAQARLQEATAGLAAGLRKLADGDLSFQLTESFAPDFEQLRHDLNQAVAQLGSTLSEVAQATSSIDGGSNEISRSSDDLARRTEQQAASLEETAAALDEITTNVSTSSKRVNEAREVAVEANRNGQQSAEVVSNAIVAMQRIEQSSGQISQIISVIDEIAFQTNLLALNAGVEAARAGEAGKGFAVVAQEVRELAQRSASAAKEIKQLITQSGLEVSSGVKLVSDTGDALQHIIAHVGTINQHMDAISQAAREQSLGLNEVNTAVNQMDQVTQQNAAMVEETNAASATLASEAVRLRDLVGAFRLPQGRGASARIAA